MPIMITLTQNCRRDMARVDAIGTRISHSGIVASIRAQNRHNKRKACSKACHGLGGVRCGCRCFS
jgi:hypothetical protein